MHFTPGNIFVRYVWRGRRGEAKWGQVRLYCYSLRWLRPNIHLARTRVRVTVARLALCEVTESQLGAHSLRGEPHEASGHLWPLCKDGYSYARWTIWYRLFDIDYLTYPKWREANEGWSCCFWLKACELFIYLNLRFVTINLKKKYFHRKHSSVYELGLALVKGDTIESIWESPKPPMTTQYQMYRRKGWNAYQFSDWGVEGSSELLGCAFGKKDALFSMLQP